MQGKGLLWCGKLDGTAFQHNDCATMEQIWLERMAICGGTIFLANILSQMPPLPYLIGNVLLLLPIPRQPIPLPFLSQFLEGPYCVSW